MFRKPQVGFLLLAGLIVVATALATTVVPERTMASDTSDRGPIAVRPATPVYMANGKLLTNVHEVIGSVRGVSPATVTLAGSARFWNAGTYFCVAAGTDDSQTLGPQVVNIDGSQFRIVHASAGAAAITYRCLGM